MDKLRNSRFKRLFSGRPLISCGSLFSRDTGVSSARQFVTLIPCRFYSFSALGSNSRCRVTPMFHLRPRFAVIFLRQSPASCFAADIDNGPSSRWTQPSRTTCGARVSGFIHHNLLNLHCSRILLILTRESILLYFMIFYYILFYYIILLLYFTDFVTIFSTSTCVFLLALLLSIWTRH